MQGIDIHVRQHWLGLNIKMQTSDSFNTIDLLADHIACQ
jgi:hypothetical protein